jgi:hypothetical protein
MGKGKHLPTFILLSLVPVLGDAAGLANDESTVARGSLVVPTSPRDAVRLAVFSRVSRVALHVCCGGVRARVERNESSG